MWMPRPQLQFMNFYAHLSSVPGLPNCSYANELQRVFSSLSSPSSHPSKKRVATKQRRQRRRRRSCCHVECVTHVYCTKRGGRNVLNYCIALIYTLLQPSFPVPSSQFCTSRRTRRTQWTATPSLLPFGNCILSPMQL